MSRREIVVNTLLGAILIGAFALIAALFLGAYSLGLYGLGLVVKHFFPSISDDAGLLALICLLALMSIETALRKRLWLNALLAFLVLALPVSAWFVRATGLRDVWWFYLMFMLLLIPNDRSLRRWEASLGVALVAFRLLHNFGVLGNGTADLVVSNSTILALFAWAVVRWRLGELTPATVNSSSQVSS